MSFAVLSCNFTYRGAAFVAEWGGVGWGGVGVLSAGLAPSKDRDDEEASRRRNI